MLLIKITPLLTTSGPFTVVTIPDTSTPSCKRVNVLPTPVKLSEISSKIKLVVGSFLLKTLPANVLLVEMPGWKVETPTFPYGGVTK